MQKFILSKVVLIMTIATMSAIPATAGEHPAYIKALANLRAARWLIDHHPADREWVQSKDEAAAVRELDAAISEIKHAAIDDHKDVNAHVNAQEGNVRLGRLRAAVELLRKTRTDIAQKEDENFAKGLQARVFQHVDGAIAAIERAIAAE